MQSVKSFDIIDASNPSNTISMVCPAKAFPEIPHLKKINTAIFNPNATIAKNFK